MAFQVNKESHAPGEVWSVQVPPGQMAVIFCLNSLDSGSGSRQAVTYNFEGLIGPGDSTNPRAVRTTDRAALLWTSGTWYIYTGNADLGGAKEDYLIAYVENLQAAAAFVSMMGSSALNKFELLRWAGATLDMARDAADDADFGKTLIGGLVRAQLAGYSLEAADYARLQIDDLAYATGKSNATAKLLQTAAALLGNDTSDNTLRALVAFALSADISAAPHALVTAAVLKAYDLSGTTHRSVSADLFSNAVNGRTANSARGIWTASVDAKYDVDGALVTPTSMSRYVRTSQASAAAAVVLATLDCRGLTNKSFIIETSEVSAYDLQVSADGTNWVTIAAAVATAAGNNVPTDIMLQQMKAFRHVRMLSAGAGFAATVVGTISAQGA